jgi:hypothetical protein
MARGQVFNYQFFPTGTCLRPNAFDGHGQRFEETEQRRCASLADMGAFVLLMAFFVVSSPQKNATAQSDAQHDDGRAKFALGLAPSGVVR